MVHVPVETCGHPCSMPTAALSAPDVALPLNVAPLSDGDQRWSELDSAGEEPREQNSASAFPEAFVRPLDGGGVHRGRPPLPVTIGKVPPGTGQRGAEVIEPLVPEGNYSSSIEWKKRIAGLTSCANIPTFIKMTMFNKSIERQSKNRIPSVWPFLAR
jgi:hypothetical protein